jgi:hypothetical protein
LTDFEKYARLPLIMLGLRRLQLETTLGEDISGHRKGETQWETRAARKIRKRARNRTPKNKNKNQKTSLISSQREGLDGNHVVGICTTALPV